MGKSADQTNMCSDKNCFPSRAVTAETETSHDGHIIGAVSHSFLGRNSLQIYVSSHQGLDSLFHILSLPVQIDISIKNIFNPPATT